VKIALAVPASAAPRSGNQHTAARWRRFLADLGHRVRITTDWQDAGEDVLIALHARRSHPSIERFARTRPGAPLVVVLTGTDLYRDIRTDSDAKRSLVLARRLVVLQEAGLSELAPSLRRKTDVVYQSSAVRLAHRPLAARFRIGVVGHLRAEKDPFRAVQALAHLDPAALIELIQLGDALQPAMRTEALAWMRREPRYRWLGSRPHAETMRWLASCHALVVSSVMEGGANVICEAARIGVPVLASRIRGNLGMLGADYPGYYRVADERALARLMARCLAEPDYYRALVRGTRARRARFAPAAERAALARVLRHLR